MIFRVTAYTICTLTVLSTIAKRVAMNQIIPTVQGFGGDVVRYRDRDKEPKAGISPGAMTIHLL